MKSKIFLDGGDPAETKEIIDLLGRLDGQTTNPTLISKNPAAVAALARGEKFSSEEILDFYRTVVSEISDLIPAGSVSVEVYTDADTTREEMIRQGREMFSWIPNAHIKLPTTKAGLDAAEQLIGEGMRVNMTLCFTQEQGAAVYAATRGAARGQVFVSPFIGRIDDRGENGMGLIENILKMYQGGDGHVQVLTASVRSLDHLLAAIQAKSDIVTVPFDILKKWADMGMPLPDDDFLYKPEGLAAIAYKEFDLGSSWQEFNVYHELTEKGIERFSNDWNALIK